MLIDSDKLISITQLQRELTQKVRGVVSDGETLYITKNSKVVAAMIPFKELEYLNVLDEIFEYLEIKDMIDSRMKEYDPDKSIPWDEVKERFKKVRNKVLKCTNTISAAEKE